MGIRLTGSITVDCDGKEIELPASAFGLEEGGPRHLGEGEYQYEALFIACHEDNDGASFRIHVQAVQRSNGIQMYEAEVVEGDAEIVSDDLDGEAAESDDDEP